MEERADKESGDADDTKALVAWLQTFPQLSKQDDNKAQATYYHHSLDGDGTPTAVLHVAREIFECSATDKGTISDNHPSSSWSDLFDLVNMEMPQFIHPRMCRDPTPGDECLSLLAALLCKAVSENCSLRETYISRIMGLEKDVQRSLMLIIERGSDHVTECESEQDSENDSEANARTFDEESAASPQADGKTRRDYYEAFSSASSGYTPSRKKMQRLVDLLPESHDKSEGSHYQSNEKSPTSLGKQRMELCYMEEELNELRKHHCAMKNELDASRKREEEFEESESRHRFEIMKVETAAILRAQELDAKHRNEVAALTKKVAALANELKRLREFRDHACNAKEEIISLRGEIDILQHANKKLAMTEEQLRKCKVKLEQMGDAKEALDREEQAHSASIAQCLQLENELKALQPLRRQLEDYKTRAVDAEVELAECQENLRRLKDAHVTLRSANKELEKWASAQRTETEEIRKKLIEYGESGNSQDGCSIGEGMSELNPALKEEILRLRNENACLKAFAAKREDDSVRKLEERLDDKERLSKRYKEQCLSTQEALDNARRTLIACEEREVKLKDEVVQLTRKVFNMEKKSKEEGRSSQKKLEEAEAALQATKKWKFVDRGSNDIASVEKEMNGLLNRERRSAKTKLVIPMKNQYLRQKPKPEMIFFQEMVQTL